MTENKSKEQIEAEILKEAQAAAAKEKTERKEKGSPAPLQKEKKTEKPTTKEKLEGAAGSKGGGVVKQALETVKTLRKKPEEQKERKVKFERVYTVPIKKPVSRTRRTRTAARTLRAFILKHSKAKEVKIEQEVNHYIWARGYQKPPNKVRVSVSVDEEGVATVSLKK
ncbi:TPA: 60S ribosomal protein L31 [archaeon]|uniref:Large ribosomal subunit protein eL31 n=1 Tax=Candidatus Naiadarchaeum limnaeum TaxID=2756139 RepID=A0A832UN86_9ARCH|nr:60S ribosomal protein L31 [Candidatus Naiadarchaeales archaeon SRR2090153.bin1042]HIK00299.1 60S ribosomal protein L31 [Candidatus Naiadarchaeum limnaeum]